MEIQMESKSNNLIGLDNLQRPAEEEQQLNDTFAVVFGDPAGAKVLEYLRSISIETVGGPNIDQQHLMHLEGQRYIVGLIQRRINKGKSQKIVKEKTNE